MMKLQFYFIAEEDTYRETILDVIRIFEPAFQWAAHEQAGEPLRLACGAEEWTVQIGRQTVCFSVKGLDENQRRRLLKQQIYLVLCEQGQTQVHPWGIVTGVRPTKIARRYRERGLSSAATKQTLQKEYLLSEEKADLLLEVIERQRPFLPTKQEATQGVSVYLSIPFCPTRCAYCSFPSFCLPKAPLQETYLTNLLSECQVIGTWLEAHAISVQTLYIGGGTPTSLSAFQLERLLEGVQLHFHPDRLAEFTVEAGRPDTITSEKLQLLYDFGVGRISINPQSFSQRTLERIGRRHTVQEIFDVYALAREVGFDSINMDLITGLPGEQAEDFCHSLQQIARLQPENLTVHTLAVKRTAALRTMELESQSTVVQEMEQQLQQWLKGQAYVPYYLYRQKHMIGDQENVGYCLPGKESLYNIQMMEERQTILGLGVGSTSKFVNPADWTLHQVSNPKDLYYYNERIAELIEKKLYWLEQYFSIKNDQIG